MFAIILANCLNFLISVYFEGEFTYIDLLRSTIIPIILAPLLSWHLISKAFQLARIKQELKKLITYDSLTQLLSREAFLDQSRNLYLLSIDERSELAMVSIDLDHFKMINDKYGHSAGDYALHKFGELVNKLITKNYICGRLGGEEFALTMPNTGYEQAKAFSELLRQKLDNSILIHNNNEIKLTTSLGITILDVDKPQSLDELLVESDKALYFAKTTGRNKSVVYDAEKILKKNLQTSS